MKYSLMTYPLPLETQNGNKNSLGNKKKIFIVNQLRILRTI